MHLPETQEATEIPRRLQEVARDRGRNGSILVVVPQPFYADRGSPIAVRSVVDAYLHLGNAVDVVTFPVGHPVEASGLRLFRAANPFGFETVPIGFSLRKILLDLPLTTELHRRLRTGTYRLVHAVEEAAFPAVFLTRFCNCPVVYDMHSRLSEGLVHLPGMGRGPLLGAARAAERWLFRRANVIVTSTGLAEEVRSVIPESKLFEWRFSGMGAGSAGHGPDPTSIRQGLGLPPGSPVVLYAGTFSRYQGLNLLLTSVPFVARRIPSVTFVLLGADEGEEEPLRRRADELGVLCHVRFVARRPRSEMPGFLRMADVVVSPRTTGANLPLKIFDYLAAGRPIVATDIPTHRALLDQDTALLTPPTPEELGDAIAQVLTNPRLAAALEMGATRYARSHLGWERFLETVDRIKRVAIHGC